MISISGMISIRASDSDDCLGPSLTGMTRRSRLWFWGRPTIPPDSESFGAAARKRFQIVPVMFGGFHQQFDVVDGLFEAGPGNAPVGGCKKLNGNKQRIAVLKPQAVAISASAIPPLTFTAASSSCPTKLNERMIPVTVPSNPNSSASVINVPSTQTYFRLSRFRR